MEPQVVCIIDGKTHEKSLLIQRCDTSMCGKDMYGKPRVPYMGVGLLRPSQHVCQDCQDALDKRFTAKPETEVVWLAQ